MSKARESSDEQIITQSIYTALKRTRSVSDVIAFAVATCGVGLIPLAPGTWGAAVGVGVYWLINSFGLRLAAFASGHDLSVEVLKTTLVFFIAIVLTAIGIPAATRVAQILKRDDPGCVVIDEVIGQLVTFLCVSVTAGKWTLLGGFLLFRLFDIWKPTPVRELESLHGGIGIIFDDIAAGIYAAACLSILTLAAQILF